MEKLNSIAGGKYDRPPAQISYLLSYYMSTLAELALTVEQLSLRISSLNARLNSLLSPTKTATKKIKEHPQYPPPGEGVLRFSGSTGKSPYICFSPLYKAEFTYDGKTYGTVEAFVHAIKYETTKPELAELIRSIDKPATIRMTGNAKKYLEFVDPEYDIRLAYCKGYSAQFRQNETLLSLLMSTGEAFLEGEYTDPVLGIGVDGEGQNILGNALRFTRHWLKE